MLRRQAPPSARSLIAIILLTLIAGAALWPTARSAHAQDDPAPAPAAAAAESPDAADAPDKPDTPAPPYAAPADDDDEPAGWTLQSVLNDSLNKVNAAVSEVMFFDISFNAFKKPAVDDDGEPVLDPKTNKPVLEGPELPFTIIILICGAIFYTFYHGWINVRGFKHSIDIVRGKFTREDDTGDITPFRALTSALSATVGLGNIAGVAIAVKTGGPGAIFWMMFLGLFGMTAKFHESTLAQMFRTKNTDGTISGGPMYYLDKGLGGRGLGFIGKPLAIIFAVFCLGGALGGGNMFQSNQAFEGFYTAFVEVESLADKTRRSMSAEELRPLLNEKQLEAVRRVKKLDERTPLEEVRTGLSEDEIRRIVRPKQVEPLLPEAALAADVAERSDRRRLVSYGFGALMASMVAVVVIGGITRIGAATSKIVPAMCLLYVGGCTFVIIANANQVPSHVGLIFTEAFNWDSVYGGLIGVIIIGFTRAAFSSEAGLGSSAIAHSAAKADHPVREGLVASLEPFIDTIIICFMTAMVVLITDAYIAPEFADETNGSAITLYAFRQTRLGGFFPYVLSVSIVLFAFSTMISWCYYGERAWGYLVGLKSVIIFRIAFVAAVFVGAVTTLEAVIGFSDLMILSMAFPNILGGILLASLVKKQVKEYWRVHRFAHIDKPDTNGPGAGI